MLQDVIRTFDIHGMADIPCGDMHWLPHVGNSFKDVKLDYYLGADVSPLLISHINLRIESLKSVNDMETISDNDQAFYHMLRNIHEVNFEVINLIEGPPLSELTYFSAGKIDLILCRDMMIHLSQQENLAVLRNIQHSGAKYFMATTYINVGDKGNVNEKPFPVVFGHFINLLQPPYCLVSPLRLYRDGKDESSLKVKDGKYLGLWAIEPGKSLIQDSC